MLQINMKEGSPLANNNGACSYLLYDRLWRIGKSIGNGAIPGGATFPPTANLGFDSLPNKQHLDLAKADELLKQAGYTKEGDVYTKDGHPLQLTMGVWGKDTVSYEKIQSDLKAAGVQVE